MDKKVGQQFLYCLNLEKKEFIKGKILYSIIAILLLGITMAVGYIDTYTTRYFFITIPYTFLFIPEIIFLISCFDFVTISGLFNYKIYKRSFVWIKNISKFILLFSTMCILGESLVLIFDSDISDVKNEIIFLVGIVLVLVFDLVLYFMQKKYSAKILSFEKKTNNS